MQRPFAFIEILAGSSDALASIGESSEMPGPVPSRFFILGGISILIDVVLWLGARGIFFDGAVWPYPLAVTWIFVRSGIVLLRTFEGFLQQPTSNVP